jgi:glycosyltransferase involved in cell wall biosynthesis
LFRRGDDLYAESPFVQFLTGFKAHFDEVVLISRVFEADESTDAPYKLEGSAVSVEALPPYPRIADLYLHALKYRGQIADVLKRVLPTLDSLWLNFGHPVSLAALKEADRHPSLRCFAVMRGAYERDARMRSGRLPLVGRLAGGVMSANLRRFAHLARARSIPCFAYGAELVERLEGWGLTVFPLVDSLIREDDVEAAPGPDPALMTDLLFVGRLTPEKGGDVLINALPQVRGADGRPALLRVVGSGPREAEWRGLAERLGLCERIQWDGHVSMGPELFARYQSTRLLVMPSRTEGMPKTAYEAMRFGVPVVASRVGGLPEIVGITEERGCLVTSEKSDLLADTLNDLLADPDRLYKMGRSASQFANPYTLEGQVEHVVGHLDRSWE